MQEHTKFIASSGQLWGACCQLQQALLSLQACGEEEQEGEEAASNKPASPPRRRRKKEFIVTNGESLQQGWPFLSKLVNHTRRGKGLAVK